jgi:hypothetical protein
VPLAVFGLEQALGLWPMNAPGSYHDYHIWVNGSWVVMELATILAGAIALYFYRFPFITAPIAFSLLYLSMDLTPFLMGRDSFTWDERLWVSLMFGLATILFTFLIDRRTKLDYAFWLYLFGTLAFWGGLSSMRSDSELNKFYYCMINLGLIFGSVLLDRKVFLVFGAIGVNYYIGHLAFTIFKDTALFPLALTLLGLGVIGLAVFYQKNAARVDAAIHSIVPEELRKLLPARR